MWLLTFCYLAAFNCWLLLCPATLSHDWQMGSVPLVAQPADPRNLATAACLGCGAALLYRGLADLEPQRPPAVLLGVLLLTLPFLPASNLFITVGFVLAERVLYMPSLGGVLLVSYGAQLLWGRLGHRGRPLLVAAALLLAAAFCGRALLRNRDWLSRETLARAGLRALPHNAKMHYNLANFLRETGQRELAVHHYREALRLWPDYASAHNNLGTLLAGAEAEAHFLAAVGLAPAHVHAHYNLGQLYRRENRSAEAVRVLERCARLDPGYLPAQRLLARLYTEAGDRGSAGSLLARLALSPPTTADRLALYAAWLHEQGRCWESLQLFRRALRLEAGHGPSLLGAARALRGLGQLVRLRVLLTRYPRSELLGEMHDTHLSGRRATLVHAADLYPRPSFPSFTENGNGKSSMQETKLHQAGSGAHAAAEYGGRSELAPSGRHNATLEAAPQIL
ncbi:protein O-mannosyl-transferase TMTC1-like [Schistocerca americana]|uniref:protein O-mannosyl-transferase TMTC1-like n=1 Tax=Schistocerca americana TaxID=7009 RepID=UPI001F4FFAD9|nr:protein O-mannosyl-transferase TMTC1-like [Schistocerca americana]